ncbi:MAG: NmrA family NAD(P)-binding protein [Verrucomicrobiota bacterium]
MKNETKTTSIHNRKPVLVIGANGKTGRRLVQRLHAADIPVKAASRSSETHFDWNDRSTWSPALEGTGAAYITVYPDLSFPGVADNVEAFAKLAVSKGAKRLVLLSGRGEEGAQDAELRIQKSGAEYTIVRCSVFNQNFSDSFADAIRYGRLSMPVGDIQEPFIDAEDIADVAFAALTEDGHNGEVYELTGPRLLTLPQVVEELSKAMERTVVFEAVSVEDYATELVEHGFSEEESLPVAQLIADVMDGRNATLADGVQRALGREPRDFADFAQTEAAAGTWDIKKVAS